MSVEPRDLFDIRISDFFEAARFSGLPFPVVILPGDEEAYGGCLAAGRGFIHLSPERRLEACPFAPFSDRNAAVGSLEEALSSPMLAAIRERHGELSETKGGCTLWNRGGWIASLGLCQGSARPGQSILDRPEKQGLRSCAPPASAWGTLRAAG